MKKYGSISVAQKEAEHLVKQAKKETSKVPIKPRRVLDEFAHFAVKDLAKKEQNDYLEKTKRRLERENNLPENILG